MIGVGEFLPDASAFGNPGATEAKNVIPAANSYRPLKTLMASGSAISTTRIFGGVTFRSTDLSVKSYAADGTKIYKLGTTTWSDISRTSGGAYTVPTQGMVRFAQFKDKCLSVNGADAMQFIDMASGTSFEDLTAGTPPVGARHIAIARDIVAVARDGSNSNRVSWTDVDTIDFTAGGADIQDMADGGQIMGLNSAGDNLVVFQERCIRLGIRTDYPLTFTFEKIALDKGCLCEWATAQHENLIFFIAQDGFYLLAGGQQFTPIGAEKVNLFFFNHPEHGLDQNNLHRVTGMVDPVNKLYIVSYPSVSSDGTPDKALIFNWELGRWSRAEFSCDMLLSAMVQSSWNGDNVDTLLGLADSVSLSVDDPLFTGAGRLLPGAFTTAHELGFFNGGNMAATVDTAETQLTPGRRSFVTGSRPMVDGVAVPSVALGSRNLLSDAVTWGSATAANFNGLCPARLDARFHRARISTQAGDDWAHILGVEPEFRASGTR